MLPHLLLLAALLAACSGPREDGPSETVQALAGDDILLPCSYRVPPSNELPTVEWSKKGLEPNVVLLYRDGCETPEMKNPAFWYRTSLVTKELTLGNISLRIGDVHLSDAGSYRCTRLWKDLSRDVTEVQLVVDVGGSCLLTGLLSSVGTTCLLLTLFGLASFFCRRQKSRGGFFSPNRGSSEGRSMLPSGPHAEDENERNAVVEAEVKQLRLTVAEQADTIRQLLQQQQQQQQRRRRSPAGRCRLPHRSAGVSRESRGLAARRRPAGPQTQTQQPAPPHPARHRHRRRRRRRHRRRRRPYADEASPPQRRRARKGPAAPVGGVCGPAARGGGVGGVAPARGAGWSRL